MNSTLNGQMEFPELEARLIYAIIVAGKSARFTNAVMCKFNFGPSPFDSIRGWIADNCLAAILRDTRTGNYGKIEKAFRELVGAQIDLRTCTPEQLERIHGIGSKTSRFFILWTRPNERYAALDVHVLRWMRGLGYSAPAATPTGARYRRLERLFIKEADKRGLSARELDAQIWEAGQKAPSVSSGNEKPPCSSGFS